MLTSLALSSRAPIRRALVALPLAVAVAAAQQWSPTTPIPFDSTVIRGTLPNGLRYFIKKNAKPEKRLELQLAVRTGSLQEDDDQRGMAHYVEHMAFNGTARFPKSAIVDFLEQSGMRFGGDLNAYTSFDETVYNLTIPTDSTHLVTRALDVMRDWAGAVSFDSLEFERERGVVLEEWRSGRGAQQRVAMKHYPYQFYGSRYTERLPIGTQQSLERASRAALMRYYADWYRPDLMAVVAVGDIDPEQLRTMIVERFGSLKNPAAPRPRVAAMIPDHDSTFVSIAADKEYQGNIITVLWKSPKDSVRTVADYRRSLVAGLYGLLMGNRLSELSQRPNTPFQFAAVVHGALTNTRDVTQAFASVKGNAFAASLEAVLLEMDRVNRFGFTATELDRARANFTRGLERQVAEADKALSAGLAQQYVGSFLSGGSVPSITTVQAIATQLMAGITIDEVNRAARDWTPTRNRVVTVSAPERADVTLPTREELLAVFDKVKSATLVAFVDSTSNQPLVPTVPAGGKVVGVKSLPETGITEWTLSNGIRVLLKPTDFKNDEVRFSGRRPGGSSLFSDAEALDAGVMPFTLGGLGTFTPTTLSKALTGKVANASVAVSPNAELASGFASPKDLETMFQLLYLRFTAPRFDSLNFNVTKQALKTNLRNTANSPDAVFGDTISRVMSNYNPRVRLFNAAVLDSVNAARAFSLYQSRVKDASGFTFYFVGNFTLDGIRPLIERWIGALPTTPKAVSTWKDRGIRPPPGIVERTVRKGTEPKAETTLRFHGDFAYSWENRFVLSALRELLDIRLREALREEKGGTYGVSVSQLGSWVPYKRYQVAISFGSAPERVEELTTRMWGVIDSIAAQGASDTDVTKIKEIFIRNHETALKQNASWLNWMNDHDEDGRDQRTTLRYPALVNTLTSAMLRDAAKRYLTHQQYARFTLLPESAPAKVP